MVSDDLLIEKLYETLSVRQDDFTGQDIKHVVECIMTLKNKLETANKKPDDVVANNKKLMDEWMFGGDQ